MKLVRGLAQKDPSGVLTILNLIAAAICGILHHPDYSAVLVVVAGSVLGLRMKVTPEGKVQERVVNAATTAATSVAANLVDGTAGTLHEVTSTGQVVVEDAVKLATGVLGGVVK